MILGDRKMNARQLLLALTIQKHVGVRVFVAWMVACFILGHASNPLYAGQFRFQITDNNNYGQAGIGLYITDGLGSNFASVANSFPGLPNLVPTTPGPGPNTGHQPIIGAIFQFKIDPNDITSDDFDPGIHTNQTYSYDIIINVLLQPGALPVGFVYPLSFHLNTSVDYLTAHPGWVLVDSSSNQDTWAQANIDLTTGLGYIGIASTDSSPLNGYSLVSGIANITGGNGTITYAAIPELGSISSCGIGFFMVITAMHSFRRRTSRIISVKN